MIILIDYWAVLAAAIAYFAFSAIWHTAFFGKAWMSYMAHFENAKPSARGPAYSLGAALPVNFLSTLVLTYVLAILLALANPASITEAIALGFMVAAGFVATTQMNAVLFERKPLYMYGIVVGGEVIAAMVAAAILFWW